MDEAIRELVVLHDAVLDAQLHARLGHRDEMDQRAFDALLAIRRLDREIRMNVLPKIEHIRGVVRKARSEARGGQTNEAFVLLDGIHNLVAVLRGIR
ncbi:MAG: hypothetical protein AMXMBFR56_37090 [Polyangiaceae bacterium]